METKYAPAAKDSKETIISQRDLVDNFLSIKPLIDDLDHMLLILNENRQIVYANQLFKHFVKNDDTLSLRLGEVLKCVNASEEIGGCGASENCRHCGIVNSCLDMEDSQTDKQECKITSENNTDYALNIRAKSIKVKNYNFTLVSLADISNEKRRQMLERLFFHDVLNTAGNCKILVELMQDSDPDEIKELSKLTLEVSVTLIDQLKSQRTLNLAENSKLEIELTEFTAEEVFNDVISAYQNNFVGENKTIELIESDCNKTVLKSDKTLLKRVLGNLAKNALEASKNAEKVSLSIGESDTRIVFQVHNQTFIPRNIESQIFQRLFSTKGSGRGIGTYSVKLLTTKYLGGEVSFKTDEKLGTTFTIVIPKELVL